MAAGPLPNLIVIGAYKAGTTSLNAYLDTHPDVFMSPLKEPSFFTENWERGQDWYRGLFSRSGARSVVGEASTSYTRWPARPDVPERMAAVVPEAKLIYLVRHPIERLVSHYRYDAVHWYEPPPVDEAMLDFRAFLSVSMYALQLDRYLQVFPREQILVVMAEKLRHDRTATMDRVWAFLGLPPHVDPSGFAGELNTAEDQRVERPAVTRLRSSPVWALARRLVPSGARRALWRVAGSSGVADGPSDVTIDPATMEELRRRLQPDLLRLRSMLDDPEFDGWGLLPASSDRC